MSNSLHDLYQRIILQHNRQPVGYEKAADAPVVIEAYNPLCGDQYKLFLWREGGLIVKARFYGYGCAISKASTSVLIKNLPGKSVEEALTLIEGFLNIVDGKAASAESEEMQAFAAAQSFPARRQCAVLSWENLSDYLRQHH